MPEKCVINEVGWEQQMKSWFWMVWRWSWVPLFMEFIPFAAELEPCFFTSCHDPSGNFGVDPTQAASFWCTTIGHDLPNKPGWYPLLTRTPRCSPCDSMVVGTHLVIMWMFPLKDRQQRFPCKPCKDTSFVKRQPATFTIWMPSVCDLSQ